MSNGKPKFNPDQPFVESNVVEPPKGKKPQFNPNEPYSASKDTSVITSKGFDPLEGLDERPDAIDEYVDSLPGVATKALKEAAYLTGSSTAPVTQVLLKGYNDDEKEYLKSLKGKVGGDEFKKIVDVVGNKKYYFENVNGVQKPIEIKSGERAPKGKQIENIWGTKKSQDDDSILGTIGKNLANTIPNFLESLVTIPAAAYSLSTDKEADWFVDFQNSIESFKGKASEKSQAEMFNTKGIDGFSDLLDADRYHFTPENVAGGLSQAASSILEFLGANVLTGGLGAVAKGAGFGAKLAMQGRRIGAGMIINQGEAIEAARESGLKPREAHVMGLIYAAPASVIEANFGISSKLLGSFAARAEKKAIASSIFSQVERDAAGNLTKEGLEKVFKETVKQSVAFSKRWLPKLAQQGGIEATEEMTQGLILDSSQQIYDNLFGDDKEVGEGKFGTKALSAQAFGRRINEGILGFMAGGLGGNLIRSKTDEQSNSAYDAITTGDTVVLKTELAGALKNNDITQEQYDLAIQKINTYSKYNEQTKSLGLDDNSNKRVFELTWSNENLRTQIEQLAQNPESKIEGTIPYQRLSISQKILNENSKEMSELMKKSIADQQTTVAGSVNDELVEAETKDVLSTIKEAHTEDELDNILAEQDRVSQEKGEQTPLPVVEATMKKKDDLIKKQERALAKVAPEHKEFHSFMNKKIGVGRNFNEVAGKNSVAVSEKADALREFFEEKGVREVKAGVLETGKYSSPGSKYGVYYDVNIGGKTFKLSSKDYTNKIKEKDLTGRETQLNLILPTDSNLVELNKAGILDDYEVVERTDREGVKGKYFVFKNDELKQRQPFVIVARTKNNDTKKWEKTGNLAINDYHQETGRLIPHGREGLRRPINPAKFSSELQVDGRKEGTQKADAGFDVESQTKDFGAEAEQAPVVDVEQEDAGFTPVEEKVDFVDIDGKNSVEKQKAAIKEKVEALPDDMVYLTHLTTEGNSKTIFDSNFLLGKNSLEGTFIIRSKKDLLKTLNDILEGNSPHRGYKDMFIYAIPKADLKGIGKLDTNNIETFLQENYTNELAKQQLPTKYNFGYFTNGELTTVDDLESKKGEGEQVFPKAGKKAEQKGNKVESKNVKEFSKEKKKFIADKAKLLSKNIDEVSRAVYEKRFADEFDLLNDYKIVEDETRNKEIVEQLPSRDATEQEPSVKSIESDSRSEEKTLLDEAVKEGEAFIKNVKKRAKNKNQYSAISKYTPTSIEQAVLAYYFRGGKLNELEFARDKFSKGSKEYELASPNLSSENKASNSSDKIAKEIIAEIMERDEAYGNPLSDKEQEEAIELLKEYAMISSPKKQAELYNAIEKEGGRKQKEAEKGAVEGRIESEEKPNTPKDKLDDEGVVYQKKSKQKEDTIAAFEKKIALLKKALPKLTVVIDSDIKGAGQLDADGKTVRLNPNYNKADTPIHEFAHALIDMVGGTKNALISKGIEQLKGTKLWNETKKAYPELNDDMLAKEVLAEAIGREGAKIFDSKEKQSKFVSWLSGLFYKLKAKLGLDKNVVKKLANQLLAGNKIEGEIKATGVVQRQIIGETGAENVEEIKNNLAVARQMEEEGKSPKEVFIATGWERTKDNNKWKYDLIDTPFLDVNDVYNKMVGGSKTFVYSDVFGESDLSKAYPNINKLKIHFDNETNTGESARFNPEDNTVTIFTKKFQKFANGKSREDVFRRTKDLQGLRGLVAHELQHYVQEIEGFEKGTNPQARALSNEVLSYKQEGELYNSNKEYKRLFDLSEKRKLTESEEDQISEIYKSEVKRVNTESGYDIYKKSAGEVEARNTQKRIRMRADERREKLISETEDVAEASKKYLGYQIKDISSSIESASIESLKPQSYKMWLKNNDIDEFDINNRIDDLEAEEQTDDVKAQIEVLKNSIENNEKIYEQYVKDLERIKDFVKSKGDVSDLSLEELNELEAALNKYDDIVRASFYKDLLYNIGVAQNEQQKEFIKGKDAEFDVEKGFKGDLGTRDVWSQGLSTIGEKFPAIQAFYKKYREAYTKMNGELSFLQKKGHELAKVVIKEYQKQHGVADRLRGFVTGNGHKYFAFMANDGQLIEKGSKEYSSLTKAQKDLVDFVSEQKAELDKYMDGNKNVLLKSGAGFVETFQKSGLFKAYANYITKNYNLRNVKVKFKDPKTGKEDDVYFGDVENILEVYSKEGIISKVQSLYLLTKANIQAKNGLNKRMHSDGESIDKKSAKGKFFLTPSGKLVSMFGGEFKGDFTENYYETFMRYAQDAVFSKNMSPLMPTLTGIEMFYKSMGSKAENVSKFLDVVKKGKFLGETKESGLGEGVDAALRLLRKWTSWRFIAFNVPANIWNVMVGEYNQFRADGGKAYVKGKKRFLGSMLKGRKNAKTFNILKKFVPELVTDIDRIDPENHVGRFFDLLAFGGQKLGEGLIRGSAIIGRLSTEHYNWIDSKGNVKGSSQEQIAEREAIIRKEIAKYVSEVERVQGRYSDVEKRNFAYFELGQFFGQFKVWMPEFMSDRFANEYIDADGVKRKGSFRTLWSYGARDFAKDIATKEFYTSDKPKHVAARKQLRGMIIVATLYLAYLSASDDDDDKDLANALNKGLQNISSIYRMDNNTFLVSQPAAAMATLKDVFKTLDEGVTLKQDKKGNFKVLKSIFNLTPGHKVIKTPVDFFTEE